MEKANVVQEQVAARSGVPRVGVAAGDARFAELIQKHLEQLQVGAELLHSMSDAQLIQLDSPLFGSASIGMQLRHVLGYYERLEAGLGGEVDYDARARDPRLETSRDALVDHIAGISRTLEPLADQPGAFGRRLLVRDNGRDLEGEQFPSSLGRELAFLLSHTVHHFAIVGVMLRAFGGETPADFGVAPSTLAHRRRRG